jgi:hypothetical protein
MSPRPLESILRSFRLRGFQQSKQERKQTASVYLVSNTYTIVSHSIRNDTIVYGICS